MGIIRVVADAGPAITDINEGVWASVIMFVLMASVALLLVSFFRRYKRVSLNGELESLKNVNDSLTDTKDLPETKNEK
jgi:hypothetical protein